MMTAILADIHGNREALTACLADAARKNVERYVFLGDLVGYGADPGWVVDHAMQCVENGAVAVLGNHDAAATGTNLSMNETAAAAIDWTRTQLSVPQQNFLRNLPLSIRDGERLYVHASADEPAQWHYVVGTQAARKSLDATAAQQTFCGHVHTSTLYHLSLTGKIAEFKPAAATPIPLLRSRRWLAVIGAAGQPRDHNPAACYALLDEARGTLTYVRVPYDVASAARKIREAGLPPVLAARLEQGY
jgi:diadenosine tetraphosphatase ApaH/serine/threonine PP2A family protein phosphatase